MDEVPIVVPTVEAKTEVRAAILTGEAKNIWATLDVVALTIAGKILKTHGLLHYAFFF
jgi:hypothetical protein